MSMMSGLLDVPDLRLKLQPLKSRQLDIPELKNQLKFPMKLRCP